MSEYLFSNWELSNQLYQKIGNKKNIHDEEMFLDSLKKLPDLLEKIGYEKDSKFIDTLKSHEESYSKTYHDEITHKENLRAKMYKKDASYKLFAV